MLAGGVGVRGAGVADGEDGAVGGMALSLLAVLAGGF